MTAVSVGMILSFRGRGFEVEKHRTASRGMRHGCFFFPGSPIPASRQHSSSSKTAPRPGNHCVMCSWVWGMRDAAAKRANWRRLQGSEEALAFALICGVKAAPSAALRALNCALPGGTDRPISLQRKQTTHLRGLRRRREMGNDKVWPKEKRRQLLQQSWKHVASRKVSIRRIRKRRLHYREESLSASLFLFSLLRAFRREKERERKKIRKKRRKTHTRGRGC